MPDTTVIIIGGGASGALLAATLLRTTHDMRAIVIEPRESLGKGTAYSTTCAAHLLNVPASNMSAFPGEPSHFVDWLQRHQPGRFAPTSFVQRSIYGEYLSDIISFVSDTDPRLTHVRASANGVRLTETGVRVQCSNGETYNGAAVVLASGNAPPAPWRSAPTAGDAHRFFSSAWDRGALAPENADDAVVLIGTGLTAVDAALGLRENGHRGTICMVSRRGLLPHEHRIPTATPRSLWKGPPQRDILRVARVMKRNELDEKNWRACIDSARPHTNEWWRALPLAERRGFLRHLMPYWNVHRHRMAPEITQRIASLIARDILRIYAGRIGTIEPTDCALAVPVQLRDSERSITLEAQRVINCSGPLHDYRKVDDPLIRSLMNSGSIVPCDLGIGVEVAANGAAIDADRVTSSRIFAIGPVRFGSFIETTAMPEIRVQVADLACLLTGLLSPVQNVRSTGCEP